MKSLILSLLACLLFSLTSPSAAAQNASTVTTQPASPGMGAPNTLYGELGGKGLLYGFYYERMIVPRLGVGVGFSSWNVSVFWSTSVTIVPLFLSWYPVGMENHLYVDAGAEYVSVTDSFAEFGSLSGSGALPFIGTGYCYRNSTGGFFFKIGPLFLIAPGRVQPWANLSLGFAF